MSEDYERPDGGDGAQEHERQRQDIVDMGSITAKSERGVIHCLTIIGQIEGHFILPAQNKSTKYEHIIPQLVAIEESREIDGLLIILNTVGGDVEAGLAISEMIASMSKPTVSLVLGGGHSIGVPLAVSARVSFIAPSATMTIHPVRLNGLVLGLPQTFNYLEKMQERIVRFVAGNSGMNAQRFRELMMNTGELASDVGTVLYGEQAVNEGLINKLGGLSDALEALYGLIESEGRRAKSEVAKNNRQALGGSDRLIPPGARKGASAGTRAQKWAQKRRKAGGGPRREGRR